MKIVLTSGLNLFIVFALIAQSDFREGYVIKHNNDTINGFINYKGDVANSKKCTFKDDINVETILYKPSDIKSFRFTDSKFYISKNIKVNNKETLLFLEYLIDGIVDIYYYRDEFGDHYLIDNGTGKLHELDNTEKQMILNGKRYIKESKKYIGMLKASFQESSYIMKKSERVKLTHKSLIKISNDYHYEVCADNKCIIYERQLVKKKSTYGLLISVNNFFISELSLNDDFFYMKDINYGLTHYPSIGFYFKEQLYGLNEKLYFQFETTYSSTKLTFNSFYYNKINYGNTYNDFALKFRTINNEFLFKSENPKGKLTPTYHIGGFFKYLFDMNFSQQEVVIHSINGNTLYTGESYNNPYSNLDYGVSCGFGLKSTYLQGKEISLDVNYKRGFGLFTGLNTNEVTLKLGFQISK